MPDDLKRLTAHVAASYFHGTNVHQSDIETVITSISSSFQRVGRTAEAAAEPIPVPMERTKREITRSIRPDALVSFEDGRLYKTLTRHLSSRGLTPAAYREKHGLPADYPMSAEATSTARSAAAVARGFGKRPGPLESPAPEPTLAGKAKRAPRAKKADEPAPMPTESPEERVKRTAPYTPDF